MKGRGVWGVQDCQGRAYYVILRGVVWRGVVRVQVTAHACRVTYASLCTVLLLLLLLLCLLSGRRPHDSIAYVRAQAV